MWSAFLKMENGSWTLRLGVAGVEEPAERIEVKAAIKVGDRELSDGKAGKGQKIFVSGWETLGGGTRERHWSQKWDGATCGVDSFRHTTTRRARICGSSRDKCTVTQLYVNREILVYMLIIQHDNKMTLQFQYLLDWHLGWKRYQLGGGGGVETCKGIVLVSPGSADTQWSMWLDISTLKVMKQHCRFLHILKFCNLNG